MNQPNTRHVLFDREEVQHICEQSKPGRLFSISLDKHIAELGVFMARPMEMPVPGEAGGYAHNKHKENCYFMYLAGSVYQFTGEEKYAKYAADQLLNYAKSYTKFEFQVQRNTNPPGRLFHQILNEHMWLLYASLGFSCVSAWLSRQQYADIVDNLFQPMLDMFTVTYDYDFDRIHNHGLWAVAAVGICGIAIGKTEYVEMSVNGLDGSAQTGGFLAQLDKLFSPSGYYMEGPYYHAFSLKPVCLFAEVLHRHRPDLDIFNYKNGIIGTTIRSLLSTAYPNGQLPAMNDASQTKNTSDLSILIAISLCFKHYGNDDLLLAMAKIQNRVWLHPHGFSLSEAVAERKEIELPHWNSVELSDGPEGERGAHAFVRMQSDDGDATQLVFNYGQHGDGHGHFDVLGISLFNRGQIVLPDYGFCRWVNVEPKFGGRYLAENVSYARQTISHNLVTVDERSQNEGDIGRANKRWGTPHFFSADNDHVQAVSARAINYYPGVDQQRSLVLIRSPELANPLLIDLFRLVSKQTHQYDYALQMRGQIVEANFTWQQNANLQPLGADCGYQHLWDVSRGKPDGVAKITWLLGNSFYTWLSACHEGAEVISTLAGANDPEFNLRSEGGLILRQQGSDQLFASVLETHGYFSEAKEQCTGTESRLTGIRVIGFNEVGSVVEIVGLQSPLIVMVSNRAEVTEDTPHSVEFDNEQFSWQGFLVVKAMERAA